MCRLLVCLLVLLTPTLGRKHHLPVTSDDRRFIPISTFGFYAGGFLAVNVTGFRVQTHKHDASEILGFSIDKTSNDALNPYMETSEEECILTRDLPDEPSNDAILRFKLDLEEGSTKAECSSNIKSVGIFSSRRKLDDILENEAKKGSMSDTNIFPNLMNNQKRAKRQVVNESDATTKPSSSKPSATKCLGADEIPLKSRKLSNGETEYNMSFILYISDVKHEGLYSLYFHNCHNYDRDSDYTVEVSFNVEIEEKNNSSYLSAGEMPLPALYILMSVLFFLSGCFWVFILRKNGTEHVYRIHWIMAALVYLKSLSLLFHGINYHTIETHGIHIASWAILYYITHLLKGGLLFFTIVLIGSGWAFVKHVLSDKEKRVFMIVLPLQVLANVAYIIIEESEEGDVTHNNWREVFILVDLLCCGAVLFPVVWSIRHLQDASQTDGKATISLEKLKMFRHFYIMVVCYIYFTRIIVYLLKITVPFKYEWLDEMFKEMGTFVFFVMTGYKFRPASSNPYFMVPLDEDEYDMQEVLIGSTSINEQVVNRNNKSKRVFVDDDDSEDDEGMVFFPKDGKKKESSHDFD